MPPPNFDFPSVAHGELGHRLSLRRVADRQQKR
jgi:hypothetical protein